MTTGMWAEIKEKANFGNEISLSVAKRSQEPYVSGEFQVLPS